MTKPVSRSAAPVQALLFMLLGVFGFSIVDAATKWLTGDFGTWQIVAVTRLPPLFFALILTARATGNPFRLHTRHIKSHAIRGLFVLSTTYCFYAALRYLPLADCVAIAFAAPLFITALSGPLLGERVGWRRWSAVVIGFVGVLIAVRPDTTGISFGAILALAAALAYAFVLITLRTISGKESPHNILFYSSAFSIVVAFPFAVLEWHQPSLSDWGLMLLQGTASTLAQLAMIRAFRLGEASLLAPIEYTGLVWATMFGLMFWHEWPTAQVIGGAVLIIAASFYIAQREARIAQGQQKRDSQTVPEHASLPE